MKSLKHIIIIINGALIVEYIYRNSMQLVQYIYIYIYIYIKDVYIFPRVSGDVESRILIYAQHTRTSNLSVAGLSSFPYDPSQGKKKPNIHQSPIWQEKLTSH